MLRRQVVTIITQYQQNVLPSKELLAGSDCTIFHSLMESDLPASEKTEERLTDEAFAFIGAGTETTKQTLNAVMYYLLKNPEHLSRLKIELWENMRSPKDCPPLHVLQNLPFLVSVSVTCLKRQITSTSTAVASVSFGLMLSHHRVQS